MFLPRAPRPVLTLLSFALILLSAHSLRAQTETWVPVTAGFQAEIRVWTSGGNAYAKVRLTFPTGGWRVDWGQLTRSGNDFVANARVERWNGGVTQAITFAEHTYNLGALSPGTYTFTFKSYDVAIKSQQFDPSQVAEHWEPTTLNGALVGIRIWSFTGGRTLAKIELYFPDTGYRVVDWGQASRNGNEFSVDIKAERWTGESEARTVVVDHDYELGTLSPGSYTIVVKMHGTTVRTQAFSVDHTSPASTPKLMTESNSERAIALDSVTWLRLFPLVNTHNFSPDNRTRIVLFLTNTDLSSNEALSAVTAQAEDAQQVIHPLTVEYVGKVPGFDWLTQVIVRPPEALKEGGDLSVSISVRGLPSNKALLNIKPSGTN
jgi:hypothetical protein